MAWYPLFAHARKPPRFHGVSYTIVYEPLIFTVYWRIAPKHVRLELTPRIWQVKARTLIKRSSSLFVVLGKGDFTLKAEQLDAIKCIYDGKDVFLWLPTGFGKSETLPFVFNYKHDDGGTGGGCSVVLVVSPLVSLIMEAIAA